MIEEYPKVFAENSNDTGRITTEKFTLQLKDKVPINLRPYKCSTEDPEKIDKQINELLEKKII